ncbi:MAG: DUF1963 domain-containing protein [Sphingomonas sp.]|nr:DUF1963 domain-containing protein [Sphingomonas sp.]
MKQVLAALNRLFGGPRAATPPPSRGIADRAALDALVARTGHAPAAADRLARRALPCLAVFADTAGDAIGATRFGGVPDLPPGTPWPQAGATPLSFHAQVALPARAGDATVPDLPPSGLLSFFAARADDDGSRMLARVIHSPPGTALRPTPPPSGVERFNPVGARFEHGLSFPDHDDALMGEIERAWPEADHLALLLGLGPPAGAIGQLLGHAQWHEDLREELHFHMIGRPGKQALRLWKSWEDWEEAKRIESRMAGGGIYRPWSAADDDLVRWIQSHRVEIDAGVASWRSLLTIESNQAMDLWINDANAIYFFLPAADLARADFSNVQAITAQS